MCGWVKSCQESRECPHNTHTRSRIRIYVILIRSYFLSQNFIICGSYCHVSKMSTIWHKCECHQHCLFAHYTTLHYKLLLKSLLSVIIVRWDQSITSAISFLSVCLAGEWWHPSAVLILVSVSPYSHPGHIWHQITASELITSRKMQKQPEFYPPRPALPGPGLVIGIWEKHLFAGIGALWDQSSVKHFRSDVSNQRWVRLTPGPSVSLLAWAPG